MTCSAVCSNHMNGEPGDSAGGDIGSVMESDAKMVTPVEYFQFGSSREFLDGLAGLVSHGLCRSMEQEALALTPTRHARYRP